MSAEADTVHPGDQLDLVRPFLWRYLLPRDGKALYTGTSPQVLSMLAQHFASCSVAPRAGDLLVFAKQDLRFDVIVCDLPSAIREPTLGSVLSLAAPEAMILILLRTPGAAERLIAPVTTTRLIPRLRRRLRLGGFNRSDLFWFRDGLFPPQLYAISRLGQRNSPDGTERSRLAWYVRPRHVAILADRGDVLDGVSPAVERGQVSFGTETHRIDTVWLGSGNVHRIECSNMVIRLPLHSESVARCRNNFDTLKSLAGLALTFATPRPLGAFDHQGLPCFVESRVPGRSVDAQLHPECVGLGEPSAISALIALQRRTRHDVRLNWERFRQLIVTPCSDLMPSLPSDLAADLNIALEDSFKVLADSSLPLVYLHGDFKGTNILWHKDWGIASIVDWDLAAESGLPVIDFVFFSAYERVARQGGSFGDSLAQAGDPALCGAYQRFALSELGLSPLCYALCSLMAIIRYGGLNAGFHTAATRSTWCARNLNSGLRHAVRRVSALARNASDTH